MWAKFSENPFMFKVNYVNGDRIESTKAVSGVLGSAFHKAMETCLKSLNFDIQTGYDAGLKYINEYNDGFIEWSKTIANKDALISRYSFTYFGYIKEFNFKDIKEVLLVEEDLTYLIDVDDKAMPIPLRCKVDLVYKDHNDKIRIVDHKSTSKHSDADKIDGEKLIQSAFNFFTVQAKLGVKPNSISFNEMKYSENREKTKKQMLPFTFIYDEVPLMFDLFYRFYEDVTSAFLGKQVFVPNFRTMFDNEVSILAYIHRLDIEEERAKQLEKLKVDNITDFLKIKIEKSGKMKKYLDTVSKNFVSARNLNYKEMKIEERIRMKLAEHGLAVEFKDLIQGSAVTMYRFEPSIGLKMSRIEAYAKDIEQVVETSGIRVLAPIPDSGYIGFEIPNKDRTFPVDVPKPKGFELVIGLDLQNNVIRKDIREMPHLLVSGTTGSGKSVFILELINQLLKLPKNSRELFLMDPKMVELGHVEGAFYHSDILDIYNVLNGLLIQMNERYDLLKRARCKDIGQFIERKLGKMPHVFVVIDEFGDLIVQNYVHVFTRDKTVEKFVGRGKNRQLVEETIQEKYKVNISKEIQKLIIMLTQKARGAGIHLILTTQRPSVKIVDGAIKANLPARVCFKVVSSIDSVVVLDQMGGEKLLGKGDMLWLDPHKSALQRLQGFKSE